MFIRCYSAHERGIRREKGERKIRRNPFPLKHIISSSDEGVKSKIYDCLTGNMLGATGTLLPSAARAGLPPGRGIEGFAKQVAFV